MTAFMSQMIDKYQGVASSQVIHAVEKAAARTGADFSFLMDKASAESGFNPAAKAKSSTATGLFQFIESTWLSMMKEHGAKYGLGKFAEQIQTRGGKPCVDDCKAKDAILNLRKNPEIAALMAGEYSAGNKKYLAAHTGGDVGATELYLSHFMGASGAAKFINSRDANGDAVAARLFPKEAAANKNVFFDQASGHARTLNDIYDLFAKKFNRGTAPSLHASAAPALPAKVEAGPMPSLTPINMAQVLLYFNALNKGDSTSWNESMDYKSGFTSILSLPATKLSAENILLMAQMQQQPARIKKTA